jgi:hypothetical protein
MKVVNGLRECRWHARRLGDAFAWVILGGDEHILAALSQNKPVAVPGDSHGSRGMLLVANHLAEEGWGFPLIHDITDCLRVGDATFIRVLEDSDRSYKTIEVKTKARLKRTLEDEGLTEYEYQIEVLSTGALSDEQNTRTVAVSGESENLVLHPNRSVRGRIDRQVKRMSTAQLHLTALPNTPIKEDGGVLALWTAVNGSFATHWKPLQRVVRKARRNGYGSECVDNTFLYAAFYSADGLSPDSMSHDLLRHDLLNPALLVEDGDQVNALSIAAIPPPQRVGAYLCLPFYLYPIPRSSVCDIIHGRLIIFVAFNEGRLAECLEQAGFNVEIDYKAKGKPFVVDASVTAKDGSQYRVRLPDLRRYFDGIIYGFRGREALKKAVQAMVNAGADVAADLDREQDLEWEHGTASDDAVPTVYNRSRGLNERADNLM